MRKNEKFYLKKNKIQKNKSIPRKVITNRSKS